MFLQVAFVLSELLLTENIQKELKQYHKLFLRATFQKPKAQRYLLRGVEIVIANHKATLVAKVSHVLKILYDLDLVEEQAFLEWAKKSSKRTNVSFSCGILWEVFTVLLSSLLCF